MNKFFNSSGQLNPELASLLVTLLDYPELSLRRSVWKDYQQSFLGRVWFWITRYPAATVCGSIVFYNKTYIDKHYSSTALLCLIAHEEYHRQEIHTRGLLRFYLQYLWEGSYKPYRRISSEIGAMEQEKKILEWLQKQ